METSNQLLTGKVAIVTGGIAFSNRVRRQFGIKAVIDGEFFARRDISNTTSSALISSAIKNVGYVCHK
jgi:hypothetical protein